MEDFLINPTPGTRKENKENESPKYGRPKCRKKTVVSKEDKKGKRRRRERNGGEKLGVVVAGGGGTGYLMSRCWTAA
jgi:hypothetical protein